MSTATHTAEEKTVIVDREAEEAQRQAEQDVELSPRVLTTHQQKVIFQFAAGGHSEVSVADADWYIGLGKGTVRQLILANESIAKKFSATTKVLRNVNQYFVNCDAVRRHYRKPLFK